MYFLFKIDFLLWLTRFRISYTFSWKVYTIWGYFKQFVESIYYTKQDFTRIHCLVQLKCFLNECKENRFCVPLSAVPRQWVHWIHHPAPSQYSFLPALISFCKHIILIHYVLGLYLTLIIVFSEYKVERPQFHWDVIMSQSEHFIPVLFFCIVY